MIFVRADANAKIGTGHVMRCLSIVAALQKQGKEVCFIGADEETASFLAERGWQCEILHSVYDKLETELPKMIALIRERKPETLLVDSYFVTEHYLATLRECVRTAYMDDLLLFPYPVDVLINYNIYGEMLPYAEKMPDTRLCLGTGYVPLRQEFSDCGYAVKAEAEQILITTGGSDKYNLAGKILEAVLSLPETKELQFHVVSGMFNPNFPALQKIEEEHQNVQIHCNVKNMAELMRSCDVAVTAGGSTMYELCAVGVPILCFSFVDNQEKIVETFAQKNLVSFGGNYLTDGEQMISNLVKNLALLAADRAARESYSKEERKLVDGLGAKRIAEVLAEMV